MIGYFLLLIIVGYIANNKAKNDASDIAAEKPIDHGKGLTEAAISCAVGVLVSSMLWGHHFDPVLFIKHAFALSFVAWGWFTPWFRFLLNRKRGKDWRYISPSNWYDWQYLRLFSFGQMSRGEWIDSWAVWSRSKNARKAGTISYAFELAVFTASTILYFIL